MSDVTPDPSGAARAPQTTGAELKGGEPKMWVGTVPFTKDGFPARASFGRELRDVVVLEMATWKRLCADNPGLQTTLFAVGRI